MMTPSVISGSGAMLQELLPAETLTAADSPGAAERGGFCRGAVVVQLGTCKIPL